MNSPVQTMPPASGEPTDPIAAVAPQTPTPSPEELVKQAVALLGEARAEEALAVLKQAQAIIGEHGAIHTLMAKAHLDLGHSLQSKAHLWLAQKPSPGFSPPRIDREEALDTAFLDPERARAMARRRLRGEPPLSMIQLCLCFGQARPDDPPNLIVVPMGEIREWFANTRTRLPKTIDFDVNDAQQAATAMFLAQLIDRISLLRHPQTAEFIKTIRSQPPLFSRDEPLRILLPTSRWTTVMQYASRGLHEAFRRLGCDSHLLIEENELEQLTAFDAIKATAAINPHVTVNINHISNQWLHPATFNVVWWQDPMPAIENGDPLPWRKRDMVLSAHPHFDELVRRTGAHDMTRQDYCMDPAVFHARVPLQERRKILFVGSAYTHFLENRPNEDQAVTALTAKFDAGEPINDDYLDQLIADTGLSPTYMRCYVYPFVVRMRAMEWLCAMGAELKEALGLELEIYGQNWEKLDWARPFHKGMVQHGEALAELYNQARYVLALHPQMVKSQRLAEAAGCGCVPVLNDDRANAEGPHWDEQILYFRTAGEMKDCFTRLPPGDPCDIGRAYSYDALAQRIVDWVWEQVASDQRRAAQANN